MKRALITGVTGQFGTYLSELLLREGYEVFGLVRRSAGAGVTAGVRPIEGDLRDGGSLVRAVEAARPTEVYNLGAQTLVVGSWQDPETTGEVTGLGAQRMLDAVLRAAPDAPPAGAPVGTTFRDAKQRLIEDFERRFIGEALARHRGNISKAAEEMGMYRQQLQQKLADYGIDADAYRREG